MQSVFWDVTKMPFIIVTAVKTSNLTYNAKGSGDGV
jgi:hypothetical protein